MISVEGMSLTTCSPTYRMREKLATYYAPHDINYRRTTVIDLRYDVCDLIWSHRNG